MVLWTAAVVMLASGVLLAAWGARGRRINDHPICRKCGFDLLGLPPLAHRCPECGRDIRMARSVRRGARQRRRGVIAVGVVVVLVGGSGAGSLGFVAARGVNWNRYKPTWLLNQELRASTSGTASAAGKELAARLANGDISRRAAAKIIDAVLQLQGNPSAAWDGDVSGVLTEAREQDLMTDEQLTRFIRQSMSMTVSIPAAVIVGEPILVMSHVSYDATAHWMDIPVLISYEVIVDGKSVDAELLGAAPSQADEPKGGIPRQVIPSFTNGVVQRTASGTLTSVFHLSLDLVPGEHDVVIRLHNRGILEKATKWNAGDETPRNALDGALSSWIEEQTFRVFVRE